MMSLDDAVKWMRGRPEYQALVHNAYLGSDVQDSAYRFQCSGEFRAVKNLLGGRIKGAHILDLGAGTGIASYAFLHEGAARVTAVEPDSSMLVGAGALRQLCQTLPVDISPDFAEHLSTPDSSIDIVYARQVLHHMRDLPAALRECSRVLKPKGIFLACREHVVDSEAQLKRFLAAHPMHQLAGGENAFSAEIYRQAIADSGLELVHEIRAWDSVINAHPFVEDENQLADYPRLALQTRWGAVGTMLGHIPGTKALVWLWLRRNRPGRMYTYLAVKP